MSEEEKNAIREQHAGGMKVITENFYKLLNSKLGNVKPLVSEATMAPEPVFARQQAMGRVLSKPIEFGAFFPEGGSVLPKLGKAEVVTYMKDALKSSLPTIIKFIDSGTLPKFITISVGTSSTGTPEENRIVGRDRIDAGIQIIELAFAELGKETGEVVSQEYIQKFLTTNANYSYEPTKLAKIFDRTNSKSKPEERFIVFKVSPLETKGLTSGQVGELQGNLIDASSIINTFLVDNVDEKKIVLNISQLQTYSDITDLNKALIDARKGDLETFLNDQLFDNPDEKTQVVNSLNNCAKRSGKTDVAKITDGDISILLSQ